MGAVIYVLLVYSFFLLPIFLAGLIMALLGLLLAKPKGLRPPWWDWGMDKPIAKVKAEPVRIEEAPAVVAVEVLPVVKPEVATEVARPRW